MLPLNVISEGFGIMETSFAPSLKMSFEEVSSMPLQELINKNRIRNRKFLTYTIVAEVSQGASYFKTLGCKKQNIEITGY